MMNHRAVLGCATIAMALASFGCSGTVRYMTATHWTTPPEGAAGGAAPAAAPANPQPASQPAQPSGEPLPAAAAPPVPAPKAQRVLYVTYWEGTCNGGVLGAGRGCAKGDSHVKRCNVQADNTLVCVDEKEIAKILATE